MSTQSLTELKRTPKYCTNPFSEHGASKSSDLRWVTEDQANKYPSKVSLGQKICSKCRKRLAKLPCESKSLELTLPEGSSCKEMAHDQPIEEHYEEFIDPDTEMDVLNKSIEIIGESLVKKQRIKSSAYISSKKSKIQQTVSLRFDNACGLDIQRTVEYQNVEMDPPPNDENAPVIRSLIEKYRNTVSRSGKN